MTPQRSGPLLLRIAMTACQACGRQTKNPMFCSRSCAIRVHNQARKREPVGRCVVCAAAIARRRKYCWAHSPTRAIDRTRPIETFVDNFPRMSMIRRASHLAVTVCGMFGAAEPPGCENLARN